MGYSLDCLTLTFSTAKQFLTIAGKTKLPITFLNRENPFPLAGFAVTLEH